MGSAGGNGEHDAARAAALALLRRPRAAADAAGVGGGLGFVAIVPPDPRKPRVGGPVSGVRGDGEVRLGAIGGIAVNSRRDTNGGTPGGVDFVSPFPYASPDTSLESEDLAGAEGLEDNDSACRVSWGFRDGPEEIDTDMFCDAFGPGKAAFCCADVFAPSLSCCWAKGEPMSSGSG